MNFSVLVPSMGRPTLTRTLESIIPQLKVGDELLVDVNADGDYGAAARNRLTAKAEKDFILYMDDDDVYLPGALDVIRSVADASEPVLYIFRMHYRGSVIWGQPTLVSGNVSTQMLVVPNDDLPDWSPDRRDHDFTFATECAERWPVVWCDEVIAAYGGRP